MPIRTPSVQDVCIDTPDQVQTVFRLGSPEHLTRGNGKLVNAVYLSESDVSITANPADAADFCCGDGGGGGDGDAEGGWWGGGADAVCVRAAADVAALETLVRVITDWGGSSLMTFSVTDWGGMSLIGTGRRLRSLLIGHHYSALNIRPSLTN